jgi:hypothetical protein
MSKRSLPALILFASLGAAVGTAVLAPTPASAGDEALKCEDFKIKKIKDACTAGANTEKKMRDQMKEWQKKAKDKGGEFKCTTCHEKSSGGKTKGSDEEVKKNWTEFEKLL